MYSCSFSFCCKNAGLFPLSILHGISEYVKKPQKYWLQLKLGSQSYLKTKNKAYAKLTTISMCSNLKKNAQKYFWYCITSSSHRTGTFLCFCVLKAHEKQQEKRIAQGHGAEWVTSEQFSFTLLCLFYQCEDKEIEGGTSDLYIIITRNGTFRSHIFPGEKTRCNKYT